MGVFFGTDGIRGIVNSELTNSLANSCGNALGGLKPKNKIVIGKDTRLTGDFLTCAFSSGAMSAGADVIDLGICPTPAIAYITQNINADFGVVISASHNKMEYNGIKIFDEKGLKLGDQREQNLEKKFVTSVNLPTHKIGRYKQEFNLVNKYVNHIVNACNTKLNGLKIVLDASNGALYNIAPKVFKKLNAEVICINCKNDGYKINENCGSLHPEKLVKKVLSCGADMGFAFDGDGDRIIACDNQGNLLDGDLIIFILAKYLHSKNMLKNNIVVGTQHTNMGIEKELNNLGLTLIRTDIGDKYVSQKIEQNKLSLGGEKSGHIIIRDFTTTGDGLLTAVKLAEICKAENTPLHKLANVTLYEQVNIDYITKDKMRVINNEKLTIAIEEQKLKNNDVRIMVRVSGTEPKIRIMVESKNLKIATEVATNLEKIVLDIDKTEE